MKDSEKLKQQGTLGADLRRHLCSVIALGYRYHNKAWLSSPAERVVHIQATRELDRAVLVLSRLISECGVPLPGSAAEIERHTYIDVDERQTNRELQARAETILQQALRHTNRLASRYERPDIAEAVFALCRDSQERVKRLRTTQANPAASQPPGALLAFA